MNELRELARAREALARAQERMRIAEHELEVSELGQRMDEIRDAIAEGNALVKRADGAVRERVLDLYNAEAPLPDGVKIRRMRRVEWDDGQELIEWCRLNMPVALETALNEEMVKQSADSLLTAGAPLKVYWDPQVTIARDLSGLLA